MKPTVGRIVHFYTSSPPTKPGVSTPGLNGQGNGPYPAIVVQVFDDADYAYLKVMGWNHDWMEGSVSEWNGEGEAPGRYFIWPREPLSRGLAAAEATHTMFGGR